MSSGTIELRGVAVHNLKHVDLDVPRRQLVVICGVSGSGKTSLALDTLYAEGQRRYIESFSAYTRQFLERIEKPAAERIGPIPPAIAVTRKNTSRSSRSTVGTTTETADYLRLLYAKIGRTYCTECGREVRRDSPQGAADVIARLPEEVRFMIAFPCPIVADEEPGAVAAMLREDGFVRAIAGDRTVDLADSPDDWYRGDSSGGRFYVVVDRLVTGRTGQTRVRDSLETAFAKGEGRAAVLIACEGPMAAEAVGSDPSRPSATRRIDGQPWSVIGFNSHLACEDCNVEYPLPEPRLFSFNSPLGACPTCEGFGNVIGMDMDLVVPDAGKTLREGAVAPWSTPAYSHELDELLALADDYDLPVDVPFRELTPEHVRLIREGVSDRDFGGLEGFFAWLQRRKYKMHLRVFLNRWRSYRLCPACNGARLRKESLATRVGGANIAEVCRLKIDDALCWIRSLELSDGDRAVGRMMLEQIESRLGFLESVGLGYLALDRTLRTLSGGEAQRVALTSALGSSLVNMLYVLDEPSIGLHPRDVGRLLDAVGSLKDRGNSVVLVEHEESMIRAADHLIEIGPGAGERGGTVVFEGTVERMCQAPGSMTGDYLAGRRGISTPARRRSAEHGRIRLTGASGNNLANVTVEFPLGLLCLVTGVSGSGKSTLVQDTLYPALCRRKHKDAGKPCPHDDVFGDGQIDEVVLIDQSPIGRSPRSNPVTYIKAFDAIRAVMAETLEARTHNYTASHFSFNVDGGRCNACRGDGFVQIDMQFLADVFMKCDQCGGTRYRREILDATYRNRNIAEILDMTVRQAFTFFRGQAKVQKKLRHLIDVGLDYLRLGQPANTLSSGEAQRLKLAGYMGGTKRGRALFILDEPTTGLHFSDVVQLLDCFDALLSIGHSLIVVEHNLQLMKAADYIIDLGPGAADQGGRIVAEGTPEEIAESKKSITGRFLKEALSRTFADEEQESA